jgi:hypothetical protein
MYRNTTHLKEVKKLIGKVGKLSKWEIYLHGSRRMAEQLNVVSLLPYDTDYDYAVGNPEKEEPLDWENRDRMVIEADKLGWTVLGDMWSFRSGIMVKPDPDYEAKEAHRVIIFEKEIGGDKVQVQWKAQFVHYKDMFESISPAYYFDRFYKKNREEFTQYIKDQMTLRTKEPEQVEVSELFDPLV